MFASVSQVLVHSGSSYSLIFVHTPETTAKDEGVCGDPVTAVPLTLEVGPECVREVEVTHWCCL